MCNTSRSEQYHAPGASSAKGAASGEVSVQKSRVTERYSQNFSKWFMWWAACLQSIASSGILFGYTAIAVSLKKQGEFSELCDKKDDEDDDCSAVDLRFSLIYTIASSLFFMSYILHGYVLDKCGPKADGVFATLCVLAGTVIIAFSDSDGFNGYVYGFSLIGIGGPGVHLALFHLTNLFERKSLAQSALVGVFVASGFVYVIFGLAFDETNVSRRTVFLAHAAWLLFFMLVVARLWPTKQFQRHESIRFTSLLALSYVVIPAPNKPDETGLELTEMGTQGQNAQPSVSTSLSFSDSDGVELPKNRETLRQSSGGSRQSSFHKPPDLSALPMKRQMTTQEYVVLLVFMCFHVLHFNFYVGSSIQQLDKLGDDGLYKTILTLVLPAGFIFVPWIGTIMQNYGLAAAFCVCNIFALLYGVLSAIPSLEVQVATFVCLSIHRVSMFACLYAYVADVFGFANFGRLSGITLLATAIVSLLQYPLVMVTERFTNGNFFWVNVALTIPSLLLFYVPFQIVRLSAAAAILQARQSMYPLR